MKIINVLYASEEASEFIKNFANKDRLLLLCYINRKEMSVGMLEELTGIRQPTLSQQLGVLRNDDLVSTRREGKRIFYSIKDPKAKAILITLKEIFSKDG